MDGKRKMIRKTSKKKIKKKTKNVRINENSYNVISLIGQKEEKSFIDTVESVVSHYLVNNPNLNIKDVDKANKRLELNQNLNCIYNNFLILRDESLNLEKPLINASLEVVINMSEVLNLKLKDTRNKIIDN